jgi:hypothetical protein
MGDLFVQYLQDRSLETFLLPRDAVAKSLHYEPYIDGSKIRAFALLEQDQFEQAKDYLRCRSTDVAGHTVAEALGEIA